MKLRNFVVCDRYGRKTEPELQLWNGSRWETVPYVEVKENEVDASMVDNGELSTIADTSPEPPKSDRVSMSDESDFIVLIDKCDYPRPVRCESIRHAINCAVGMAKKCPGHRIRIYVPIKGYTNQGLVEERY